MGQDYYLVWRTGGRQFTIEGLFDSLGNAREWVRAQMVERDWQARGNWIVTYTAPERWSIVTSGGVFRIAPIPINAAMVAHDDEGQS